MGGPGLSTNRAFADAKRKTIAIPFEISVSGNSGGREGLIFLRGPARLRARAFCPGPDAPKSTLGMPARCPSRFRASRRCKNGTLSSKAYLRELTRSGRMNILSRASNSMDPVRAERMQLTPKKQIPRPQPSTLKSRACRGPAVVRPHGDMWTNLLGMTASGRRGLAKSSRVSSRRCATNSWL
jgi:hypothetical protein